MGYYTRHELTVETGKHTVSEIALAIYRNQNIFYGLEKPNDALLDNNTHGEFLLESYDEVKWYSEPQDMIEFSKTFPDATFVVYGEGEDQGDVWEHEYKNGTMRERKQIFTWSKWETKN